MLTGPSQLIDEKSPPDGSELIGQHPLRVLIAVASEVVRSGLRTMLSRLPGVGHVQGPPDARAALVAMESHDFDVIVLSPPLDSADFEALVEGAGRSHAKTLVMLRDYDAVDTTIVAQAVAMPADGYILESGLTTRTLGDTLLRLNEGQAPMPTTLARGLLKMRTPDPKPPGRPLLLTAREMQVLSLLVEGLSNKQIANRLGVSEHGTKRHVAGVLAKLNCPNRTGAVALVLRHGLVNLR